MASSTDVDQLRWHQSLGLRWLLIALVLALALGIGAFLALERLTLSPLGNAAEGRLAEARARLTAEMSQPFELAQYFNEGLAAIALRNWGDATRLRALSETLLDRLPANSPIIAAGIWPEPRSFDRNQIRQSFYWTLRDDALRFRGDYNDPANISYHGEVWYAPARYHTASGCFWTSRYQEPFLGQPVIACAVPLRDRDRFLGVSTLVLDPAMLTTAGPSAADTAAPFHILIDWNNQVVSAAGIESQADDNIADIAQRDARFGPLAVALHDRDAALVAGLADAALNTTKIEELVQAARQLGRPQAELLIARFAQQAPEPPTEQQLSDAQGQTRVHLQSIANGFYRLAIGQRAPASIAGMPQTWLAAIAATIGLVTLFSLLSFSLTRGLLIKPLRALLELTERNPEDTALEEIGSGEIGRLSLLINARNERIRRLSTRFKAARFDPGTGRPIRATAEAQPTSDPAEKDTTVAWSVLDALHDAIVVTDSEGHVRHLNTAASSMCGWNPAQAASLPFDEVFHILDRRGRNRMSGLAKRAISVGRRSERPLQALYKTRSGHELPILVSSSPISDAKGNNEGALLILHDGRSTGGGQKGGSEARDKLTGLLDRHSFDVELAARCESTRLGGTPPFHLLVLDIDSMAEINDAAGTDGGDELLRQVGRLIQNDVGSDTAVYRLYADKFGVILNTDDSAEAQITAELLRADIQSSGFSWQGRKHEVTVTLALLEINKDSGRASDILGTADALNHQARSEGRGRVVTGVAKLRHDDRGDDRSWLKTIKRGLAEDRFHLSSQQFKSLQRGPDSGHVFLTHLSLEDDEGFWASANDFMPIAVRSNMALELDRWVIEHIFGKLAADGELLESLDCCVIPLTSASLQDSAFLDFLLDRLKGEELPPPKICFELSEQDVNSRLAAAKDFIRATSRLGCRISLSEISTKPSSLNLIKELPVDMVRISEQLCRGAETDPVDRLALESLHKICRTLGKRSIACHVDSPELLRIVQGIGIDFAQGAAAGRISPVLFHASA